MLAPVGIESRLHQRPWSDRFDHAEARSQEAERLSVAHAERAHERRSVTRRPHESRQSTRADGADGGRATHQQVGAYRVGLASTPSESAARPGGAGRPRDATAARLVLTADQARQASQRGGDRVCSRAHGLHLGTAPRPGRNRNGGRNVSLSRRSRARQGGRLRHDPEEPATWPNMAQQAGTRPTPTRLAIQRNVRPVHVQPPDGVRPTRRSTRASSARR